MGIVSIESAPNEASATTQEKRTETKNDDMDLASSDDIEEEKKSANDEKEITSAEDLLPPHRQLQSSNGSLSNPTSALLQCAELSDGMSGRSLRKLPFQSHALYVRSADPVPLEEFLDALRGGILKDQDSRETLKVGTAGSASDSKCKCTCSSES